MIGLTHKGAGRRAFTGLMTAAVAVSVLLVPAQTSFASSTLDAEEIAFCTAINNYRAANGLAPLLVSTRLSDAGDWHTNDMAVNRYFSHTDSLGRDPFVRMAVFGYSYSTSKGENIAAGFGSAADTFSQWKGSTAHNANMLNGNFKVMGISRTYNASSVYRYYWNNNFGGVVDSGAYPCPGSSDPAPAPEPTPSPSGNPAISIADTTAREGNYIPTNVKFTVSLSRTWSAPVTVQYATANGTALAGVDYSSRSGTLTINPGSTTATITVPTIPDTTREPNKNFYVNLTSPANATLADSQAMGTITNDD